MVMGCLQLTYEDNFLEENHLNVWKNSERIACEEPSEIGFRKDHLGNVHLVLSDLLPEDNTDFSNVQAAYEYYPFGMAMQTFTNSDYRYGFNGMEKDDEWHGSGNNYDFGARILDTRLGRFLSVDPMAKDLPFFSSYLFASNKPLLFVDRYGMFGWPSTSKWNYSDIQGFQNFIQTEISRIHAVALKAGYESGDMCMDSEMPDVCFDCADFAMSMLIRYAAENGKEIVMTLADGTVLNSSNETGTKIVMYLDLNDDGKKSRVTRTINNAKDYETVVRAFADAESFLADLVPVDEANLRKGDIYDNGGHAQIIMGPGEFEGRYETMQGNRPAEIPRLSIAWEPEYYFRYDFLDIDEPGAPMILDDNTDVELDIETNENSIWE